MKKTGLLFLEINIYISEYFFIFVAHRFTNPFGSVIKREPGLNPGQSRCCVFQSTSQTILFATESLPSASGRRLEDGNESENLPCIVSTAFEEEP